MRKGLVLLVLALLMAVGTAQAAEKKMKVGFVYVSPVGDAGWSYAHDVARKAIEALPDVEVKYLEAVKEGADSERVFLKMARNKYDLIFGTSFGYMNPMLKVSKKFPKTVFMHCSGYETSKNMGNYFGRMYQARYLSGMVAGAMTKSNVLGYVGAFPMPEVIRGINAFTLGARSVNPKAEVRVVWTKTWYDPAIEKEGAKSLLDVGADVIAQHQDSPGPQEAAQERGVYSIGYNTDMSSFAPKSHLVAPIWNWTPFYMEVLQSVKDGTWKSGSTWNGLAEGVVDLSPMSDMVPADVQKKVLARRDEIKDGSYVVFSGPVKDQSGTVRIADGTEPSDQDLLKMGWFVEGVIGTTK
ncbi:BMP family ABC transporter substrate-binding protein [Desulfoluna spongiiphila]|uniref:Nucleoside-binding protein n=1 Tax=Desulfoluna spongiiphila TaxID=419481 RepID=A0A1G5IFX9_9BACT|nr:BMP family ABC transporter substrate-binding protein [Desulfoluna spongiiphila]SCY74308.1 nucleoside-binding protein [Desulfoluna spongiiphila]VVS95417.1 abc transporter substrate-binding protein pnra-like [Desulfoluna spongiiphila]